MVEVDDNYSHNLALDFQWFMKLTFAWDELKNLKADLQRCSSATSFYLRIKLVQAAIELQVRLLLTENNADPIVGCKEIGREQRSRSSSSHLYP